MRFKVETSMFEYFPEMKLVVAVARGLGKPADPEGLRTALEEGWRIAAAASAECGNAQSHPYVIPWVERMRAVGVNRKKFPSSIEALIRRAGKTPDPVSINPLVDFYNGVSLKNLVPAGGFDIDELNEEIALRIAQEGDRFVALDSDAEEELSPGEICYADGHTVITRHFVWRQARHAILGPDTRNAFLVSEVLGDLPDDTADKVYAAFKDGLEKFFGVKADMYVLDENQTEIEF